MADYPQDTLPQKQGDPGLSGKVVQTGIEGSLPEKNSGKDSIGKY